jgi:SAM-dependent methyltransferase
MDAVRRCLLCDQGPPFSGVFERGGHRMVRCPRCGLVFQDPQPGEDVLAGAYYHDEDFARALFSVLRAQTLESAQAKLALLRREGTLQPSARLLDVGASSGAWVETAGAAGARASGIELGGAVAAGARERGLDVRTGTLAQALPGFGGERFDLISFWDVLEHLRDPRRELELAREALAPGGRVAATFPNVEGLYPRLTYRLIARRTGVWEYPELPVHLYDFAPATARLLFERAGLEIEALRTFATPYSFYRATSLSAERLGRGARALALRGAFELLHWVAYPVARLTGAGNAMFVLARSTR